MKNVVMDIYMYYWLLNDSNKYRDNDVFDDEFYPHFSLWQNYII